MMIYLSKMVIVHSYVMCIYIYMYGIPPPSKAFKDISNTHNVGLGGVAYVCMYVYIVRWSYKWWMFHCSINRLGVMEMYL